MLVINQSNIDAHNICIENSNGEANELTTEELTDILRPNEYQDGIDIDVVFINIPNAFSVAQVFKDLKVKQIFMFKKKNQMSIATSQHSRSN